MLVLFDIDGTLLDDPSAVRAGVTAFHSSALPERSLDELQKQWASSLEHHYDRYLRGEIDFLGQRRARVNEILGAPVDDATADRLFSIYVAAYESALDLYDDALDSLGALGDHTLGVISNGQGAQQRRKLSRAGILDRFELVAISGEVGSSKPEPTIFLDACRRAGFAPDGAVYVGDSYETDALGARRAGLTGVWLDRRGERSARHAEPIVSSLADFVALVEARVPA